MGCCSNGIGQFSAPQQQTAQQQQATLEKLRASSYAKIMAHEQAHAAAAGQFGGGIHIDYDSNGIAVGGHVPINIPTMNRQNLAESFSAYQQIKAAALAPGGDASSQDLAIAAQMGSKISQVQTLMAQDSQKTGSRLSVNA